MLIDWLTNFSLFFNSLELIIMETLTSELHKLLFYDVSMTFIPKNVYLAL
jgi:hypothetical protein